jgi:SAM-dependent methyltransferase
MSSSTELDFRERTAPRDLPELMDGDCSYEEFRSCLHSLEQVNRWSFGYRPTIAWLERVASGLKQPIRILDIGSGGGGLLLRIAAWARKRRLAVELMGMDLNSFAARAAEEAVPKSLDIVWITADALTYQQAKPIDIAVSSLMTHHLEDDEIVTLLRWMETHARAGWFINDLERSAVSARWFGRISKLVGWHRFVQHDGPVSFRRAFREEDWRRLLAAAGIPWASVTVERWRPGRLCVGRWK